MRPALLIAVVFMLLGGCRADTNGYYSRGGSTGPVHCQGACP